jgi:hypothetical protein
MKTRSFRFHTSMLAALAGAFALLALPAVAANPVDVAFQVNGTPAFGATVTVKATVTINDGSTLQGIQWSQSGGAAATLADTTTDTVSVTLAARAAYRENLIEVLGERPGSPGEGTDEEFSAGLQNRYQVVGVNPESLAEAGAVTLDLKVTTTSGTYDVTTTVAVTLPWTTSVGLRNVPVGVPVILHGKDQASYNWTLNKPTGSGATLSDPTTQSPEFTPDMKGTYQAMVTDLATNAQTTLTVIAGNWVGVITGQDANGRPTVDTACTQCHYALPRLDKFTPWAQSGHAEIFTQNVDTPNGHYGTSCISCHTVGYNPDASNGGIDDASDFQAFLSSGLLTHGDPDNWSKILTQFPNTARLANIQCENCHGPQDSSAHYKGDGSRTSLSSDVCGSCHGEPTRHGRFQEWQLSGHGNYATAISEGTNGTCAKCHTANGFLAWLPVLTGQVAGDPNANLQITWSKDEIHPQTCQTCHDPHAEGTTSGGPDTNATVRISGDTPMLQAGFVATNVGRGAICMTCHNSRRGLNNDSTYNPANAAQAPHVGPQADILMGQNLYFVDTGIRSNHSLIEDACVTCHMEATPPPPDLSYNLGGTNHTFFASKQICSDCHSKITADSVQGVVMTQLEDLKGAIEQAISNVMAAQIAKGFTIDLGGQATISDASQIAGISFGDSHGSQAITVTLAGGTQVGPVTMTSVKVVPPYGTAQAIYSVADQAIPKAAWNYMMIENDSSYGVHNPTFVKEALNVSIYAVQHIPSATPASNPAANGGPGNGVGAVSCNSPYVYWAEIASHNPGSNGSQWRTDMVTRNLANAQASLRFVLHTDKGNFEGTAAVPAMGQSAFEDIVAALGQTDAKGALEICSDQPLLVAGRIFDFGGIGTYGQFLDGHVGNLGFKEGDTASMIGLRQETDKFRTNISVTNGGMTTAEVTVTLYDSFGNTLATYNLEIPSGQVVQDLQPFVARANKPDLGWGYATITVTAGSNIQASASVIDAKTNDPVTIPAKQ